MSQSAIARALDALFDQKKPDGSPRFTDADIHASRVLVYLNLARRGEIDALTEARKQELADILDLIGITPATAPEVAQELVEGYFEKLPLNPDVFVEMDRIFVMYSTKGDRVEAVVGSEKAYDRLTEKETPKAPQMGEEAPKDSQHAQTLTLNLGGKVRI
jgi:hypothetical protein